MAGQPGPDGRRAGRSRLSRSAEFDRVYRQGRSHGNRALVLYAFPRGDEDPVRCGLSVSRKVGGAVERNRVKRVLREALRREEPGLPSGLDVVVLARPAARDLVEREGLDGVHQALRELLELAGVADDVAGAVPRDGVADEVAGAVPGSGVAEDVAGTVPRSGVVE